MGTNINSVAEATLVAIQKVAGYGTTEKPIFLHEPDFQEQMHGNM